MPKASELLDVALVQRLGAGLSFQDQGRHGLRRFGIAPCGAMDPQAALHANNLLQNHPDAVVLEIALGGSQIQLLQDTWLAFAGPLNCSSIPTNSARLVHRGEILEFTPSASGAWAYLALAGGWQAEKTFSSHSYHSRSALGSPISTGSILRSNQPLAADPMPRIALRRLQETPTNHTGPIRLLPGPHLEQFPHEIRQMLIQNPWKISLQSDRSGYRLQGPPLPTIPSIKSLPTINGCMQITSGGQALITLNDGPTVGGYPIPAILHPEDLPSFIQHPPLSSVEFIWA